MDDRPTFSFVLPACNEEGSVQEMTAQLCDIGEQLGVPFEMVWVDDGSSDGTPEVLDSLAAQDPRIRIMHLSRNFGHMAALTAGLEAARAHGAVICMDSDGQHPPRLILEMVNLWAGGADVVQTIRQPSLNEGWFKKTTSVGFYKLINLLGDIDIPAGAADFRLMDRQVVDVLNALPERARFIRGLVHWIGFRRTYLPYSAQERIAGQTKYGAIKMLAFAMNGLTSFSTRPLRLSLLLSVLVTLLALGYSIYIISCYWLNIALVPGWATLVVIVLLLGAAQLLATGIASEYIGRMLVEQKRRPVFVVRKPGEHRANPTLDSGGEG